MNIISLFDGIACGRLALQRAGISVHRYIASEIHQPSIQIATRNFPDIQEKGDIRSFIPTFSPDLLIGGSPCTNFSTIGKLNGMTDGNAQITTLNQYLKLKTSNTKLEGQSYLFWEYVRILQQCKPKYFLLENVVMKKEWEDIISNALEVSPILINSSLFSAQNRKRLYWTNIPVSELPKENASPSLSSILDPSADNTDVSYTATVQRSFERLNKRYGYIPARFNAYNAQEIFEKAPTLSTGSMITSSCATLLFVPVENGIHTIKNGWINEKYRSKLPDGEYNIRKLNIVEMERLQTLPDHYTDGVTRIQREKAIGNGWTVDVITYILSGLITT